LALEVYHFSSVSSEFSLELSVLPYEYCRVTYGGGYLFNPLMPTVAIWVQLWSIPYQTGLSRHL